MLSIAGIEVSTGSFSLGPVSAALPAGTIVSLLGPNGSGKSTLIRAVLGLQGMDRGEARWDGAPLSRRPARVLARIGSLTDSPDDVIPELTPAEFWEFCAVGYARFGDDASRDVEVMLERAHRLAVRLDLAPPRRRLSTLSLGTRRKVQLVAAMLHTPDVLVLDEPLVGLDFLSIRALEAILGDERRRGALVWMASHDLGVAGRTADRVLVLHLGRLVLDLDVAAIPASRTLDDVVAEAIELARAEAACGRP